MDIIERGNMQKVHGILSWEDLEILKQGLFVFDRYDGENKIIVNPNQGNEHCALFDRTSGDINVYVPRKVLDCSLVHASNFNQKNGTLKVIPPFEDSSQNLHVRVSYPGSEDYLIHNAMKNVARYLAQQQL